MGLLLYAMRPTEADGPPELVLGLDAESECTARQGPAVIPFEQLGQFAIRGTLQLVGGEFRFAGEAEVTRTAAGIRLCSAFGEGLLIPIEFDGTLPEVARDASNATMVETTVRVNSAAVLKLGLIRWTTMEAAMQAYWTSGAISDRTVVSRVDTNGRRSAGLYEGITLAESN